MPEIELVVGGKRYSGWKSVRVTRSIESLSGSFDLEVSDRWANQEKPWPIAEEDPCQVFVGGFEGTSLIHGVIGKRRLAIAGTQLSLSYSGYDDAVALVECSAVLKHWSFSGVDVAKIAQIVAEPFGISVSVQPGLKLPKPQKKQVVNPGDKAWEVIHTAAKSAGVLVVSDGNGGILITRAGTERAAPLVQGVNVESAAIDYDATDRFYRYLVVSQVSAANYLDNDVNVAEPAATIQATAIDKGVRRQDRVLIVRPENGITTTYARQRADWEARIRAAKAETVTVTTPGWLQPNGKLWPLNALVNVDVPRIGIKGEMLISEVELSISESGQMTQLRIVRPDAFSPEPQAVVKLGLYKEIAGGV